MDQIPSKKSQKIWIAVGLGVFLGFSVFTFFYAKGLSYLSTNPEACANCHIMNSQFDSWTKSSHHTVAVCVDCHLPTGFVDKYLAKVENGYRHSIAFTFQNFHEPIQIGKRNSTILQENCIRCHQGLVHAVLSTKEQHRGDVSCVHCHQGVGHGEYVGLGKVSQSRGGP